MTHDDVVAEGLNLDEYRHLQRARLALAALNTLLDERGRAARYTVRQVGYQGQPHPTERPSR